MITDPLLTNASLVSDLLRENTFDLQKICESLGIKAAELAALTDRTTESVARSVSQAGFRAVSHARTAEVARELVQILGLLRAMHHDDPATWLRTPLPSYGGRTPFELVRAGQGQELATRLLGLAVGDVGG